jgi:hypothetical protein
MSQKIIILDHHMKGIELDAIYEDLVRTLGKEAVVCSAVTKYIRNARFSQNTEAVPLVSTKSGHRLVDETTFTTLGECPFSSGRELFRLPLPSAFHCASALDAVGPLHGAPAPVGSHFLTAEQKRIRIGMAGKLL